MSPPLKPPETKKIKTSDIRSMSPDQDFRRPDSPPLTRTFGFGSSVAQGSTLDSWQEETEDDGRSHSRLGTDRPLMDARDSLLINHERLVEYDTANSPYLYTMEKTGLETIHTVTRVGSDNPGLSRAGSVTDRRNLNMANANDVEARKHVGWMDTTLGIDLNPEIEDALEAANRQSILRWDRTPSDIGLVRTNESLHLPSIPISQFSSDMSHDTDPPPNLLQHPSATTVTTVYAYKCNNLSSKKRVSTPASEGIVPPSEDVYMEDIDHIEHVFNYEERIQQVPYSIVTNQPPPDEVPAFDSTFQSDTGDGDMLNQFVMVGDVGETEQDIGAQTEYELGPKLNGTNMSLSTTVDATENTKTSMYNDDFDEELPPLYSSKPVFVDPALIQWPNKETLMAQLPRKYHSFLVDTYKKDCRMWLWKSPAGRRARELLKRLEDDQDIEMILSKEEIERMRNFHTWSPIGVMSSNDAALTETDTDDEDSAESILPPHPKPGDMTQREVNTGMKMNNFSYFI